MRKKIVFLFFLLILPMTVQSQNLSTDKLTGDGTLRRVRVPILMYHYVSALPSDADSIREGLTISPERFREHIEYLSSAGYTTISLYEINEALLHGTQLPEKPIVLTFDDSYTDHYTNVFPILKQYGFTGTFFVITEFTDSRNPNHMTWEQIQEMADAGMSMESHTKSHHQLVNRDFDFLVWEVIGSIESLESHIEEHHQIFSFPVGRYDTTTLNMLDTTRIIRAVTTEYGTYHTMHDYLLSPRLRISGNMGVAGLRNLLETAP